MRYRTVVTATAEDEPRNYLTLALLAVTVAGLTLSSDTRPFRMENLRIHERVFNQGTVYETSARICKERQWWKIKTQSCTDELEYRLSTADSWFRSEKQYTLANNKGVVLGSLQDNSYNSLSGVLYDPKGQRIAELKSNCPNNLTLCVEYISGSVIGFRGVTKFETLQSGVHYEIVLQGKKIGTLSGKRPRYTNDLSITLDSATSSAIMQQLVVMMPLLKEKVKQGK